MLHAMFEHADLEQLRAAVDLASWYAEPEIAALVEDAAREHGVDRAYHAHAAAIVYATFKQPLALTDGTTLPSMLDATALAREVEFAFPMPGRARTGLVRGYIDMLIAWGDELWVLDYKSDFLTAGSGDLAAAARERVDRDYIIQARLYAIAADRLRGQRRLGGLLYAFVRHDLVVPIRMAPDSIESYTRWLLEIGG
ncbi:MAG: PD-(D/E)XK nuclease family protein, partial [Proteobacteria bacterium]|nr:PD-(D/E)XK nuclease family protein [Pseudomonadota bacterium]